MPRPVDGDEGGRMEIEIYLPMQSISPALWAGLLTMPRINEATSADLKVIERLQQLGWTRGDTLFYQQEYALSINL